jgi:ketose-bisphosphate aldolase
MPLVPLSLLLGHAREHRYAVGYFESWNLESLLAVKDAAEKARSPVIFGFNGGFLAHEARKVPEDIYHYGALGRAVAERAEVPAALILNETTDFELLTAALQAGFTVIMHDHEGRALEESIRLNRRLVQAAHAVEAAVEAEIGSLPSSDIRTGALTPGKKTDPELARSFVQQTGVDALAVAAGNVHMLETGKRGLDLELIERLSATVPVPLVLHGGTGIEPGALKEAIRLGVTKVNIGTVLRRSFINALKRYYRRHDVDVMDPNDITSNGGELDMLCQAREAICGEVLALMALLGSEGRAPPRP